MKGFTLIELLVVVLIMGILAAVALPQYQVAVEKSRTAEAFALLNTLTAAQENYKMANGSYSRDFEALDVSIPFAQSSNKCSLSLGYGGPVSSIEGWDVVLDRIIFIQTPILVLRTEGPFPCYGFFKMDANLYCTEIVGGAPAEVLHREKFCRKLGGVLERNVGGWNIYRL